MFLCRNFGIRKDRYCSVIFLLTAQHIELTKNVFLFSQSILSAISVEWNSYEDDIIIRRGPLHFASVWVFTWGCAMRIDKF